MLEVYQLHLWRPVVPFLFSVSFFFFSSDLAHRAPIMTAVVVRLFAPDRDSCVLASCCGLPLVLLQWRILQFSLRVYVKSRRIFSYRLFFFCQACFSSTKANPGFYETNYQVYFYSFAGGLKTKNETKKRQQHVWYVRVILVHIHIYTLWYVYIMIQLHYSSVAACSGYTRSRDSEMLLCTCACMLTYPVHTILYILCNNSHSSSSATAASFVCCCLPYAIPGIQQYI